MSDFQRRHYAKLAEFWKAELEYQPTEQRMERTKHLYNNFCEHLRRDNPNFKRSVFDKASGYAD